MCQTFAYKSPMYNVSMENCLRCVGLLLSLFLFSCWGGLSDDVVAPSGFWEKVSLDSVSEGVKAWACVTAKTDGVGELEKKFPSLVVDKSSTWLLQPKQVFFAESDSVVEPDRWYFVFLSDDKYFIKMIVDADKQVSGFDVGCEN